MNARTLQERDRGTLLEVPPPVLFNTYKHHAGALRVRITELIQAPEVPPEEVARETVVLGTKLMDLYTGALWPAEVSARVLAALDAQGRRERTAFRDWIAEQDGYGLVELPEDTSRWVLRLGNEEERYVHLHPGRWSPATVRVRANTLKTAFLVLVEAGREGADPLDRARIDRVRARYLGLPPIGADPEEAGLGALTRRLRAPATRPTA